MSDIIFTKENGIGTITLNRPKTKNSFTYQMLEEYTEIVEKWRNDDDIAIVVLTGAEGDFCSGVDIAGSELKSGPFAMKKLLWDKIQRLPIVLDDFDKPVIAAMKGVAVGAGLDIALMCDMRFAAENARFSEGYVKVGLVPGEGGAYYLPRLVGISKALELLLTGDYISAQEALRIGMVNRVYPENQLMDETYKFARKLADGPRDVHRIIKRATYQSIRIDLRTALDMISSHQGVIRESQDSKDAHQAMLKKLAEKTKKK